MKRFKQIYRLATLSVAGLLLFSCDSDDGGETPIVVEPPILLDCYYFSNNPNAVLTDNPNAPVDYIIDCVVDIEDDVTIEPGVTIAFSERRSGIRVKDEGSLVAVGTSSKPIIFTGTEQQPGWWGGIEIDSDNHKNKISHAVIEYGGANVSVGIGGGLQGFANVTIRNRSYLELTHTTLRHSESAGLSTNRSGGGSTNTEHNPLAVASLKLENNTYTDNAIPLRIADYLVGNLGKNDVYTGNTTDKIEVTGSIGGTGGGMAGVDILWQDLGIPYWVNGDLSLGKDAKLTIEPGTVIEMGTGRNIGIGSGVAGQYSSLVAVGTADNPITIRGINPVAGSWGEIRYALGNTSPENRMEHVNITHAGGTTYDQVIYLYIGAPVFDYIHFSEISPQACSIGKINSIDVVNATNITRDVPSTANGCLVFP